MVGINFFVGFLWVDGVFNWVILLDVIVDYVVYLVDWLGEDCVVFGLDFDGCVILKDFNDVVVLLWLLDVFVDCGFNSEMLEKIFWKNWINVF